MKLIIVVERLPPVDEHDRQKNLRLRGRVEGSDEACWKTLTVPIATIASNPEVLDTSVARLKADCEEYFNSFGALSAIDAQLKRLDIKEIADASADAI